MVFHYIIPQKKESNHILYIISVTAADELQGQFEGGQQGPAVSHGIPAPQADCVTMAKSRHSREGGNPELINITRFRGSIRGT